MSMRTILASLSTLALLAPACDSADGDNSEVTQCTLNYNQSNATGKGFGESCASNAECEFGECMLPNAKGNITNTKFGFCTRGCDCEDSTAAQIPEELKEGVLECLYPSDGAGGLKTYHHVVLECLSVTDCTDVDPAWTGCAIPSTGSARKVCHAE